MSTLEPGSIPVPNSAPACQCEDGPACEEPRRRDSPYCEYCHVMYPCDHATATFSDGID